MTQRLTAAFALVSAVFLTRAVHAESILSTQLLSTELLLERIEMGKASLTVRLAVPLRNRMGQVCISLFSSEDGFPANSEKVLISQCMNASELAEKNEFTLDGVVPGTYAMALFHDENLDKKLNTGIFGIPTEGFAFSNNPPLRIGAPSFQDCAFVISETLSTLNVEFRYLRLDL